MSFPASVRTLAGATTLALLVTTTTARAADGSAATAGTEAAAGSMASWSLASTIGLPLTGLGVAIYGIYTSSTRRGSGGDAVAYRFLKENSAQLIQDLALGSGPALNDLAAAAEVRTDHLAAFGKALQADRATLRTLADPKLLTTERAMAFMQRVGALVQRNDVLVADFEGYQSRHAAVN